MCRQKCVVCQHTFPGDEESDSHFGVCRYCEPTKNKMLPKIRQHRHEFLQALPVEEQRHFTGLSLMEQAFVLFRSLERIA